MMIVAPSSFYAILYNLILWTLPPINKQHAAVASWLFFIHSSSQNNLYNILEDQLRAKCLGITAQTLIGYEKDAIACLSGISVCLPYC